MKTLSFDPWAAALAANSIASYPLAETRCSLRNTRARARTGGLIPSASRLRSTSFLSLFPATSIVLSRSFDGVSAGGSVAVFTAVFPPRAGSFHGSFPLFVAASVVSRANTRARARARTGSPTRRGSGFGGFFSGFFSGFSA